MKKTSLLLMTILSLTGCNKTGDTTINIIAPSGAPAVAFYNYATSNNFETNSVPTNIIGMMNELSDKTIVVAETISGLKAIRNGAPYKIAATITFGNFYIASTGNDENNTMDVDDKIVLFGKNQTPDLIFHYLYGNDYDNSIEYVTAVSDAGKCLAAGKNLETQSTVDYVFIAQPVLYNILNNQSAPTYGKASVYKNIQEEYKAKSNNLDMIQASIFVKDTLNKSTAKDFLSSIKSDIELGLENPELIKEGMDKVSTEQSTAIYGIPSNTAYQVTLNDNGMGLGFKYAKDNKPSLNSFIALFGLEELNEEVF